MVGFSKNMVNYLTYQLHMPLTKAANTVTNLNGTSSLSPLLGAFLADSYAGKLRSKSEYLISKFRNFTTFKKKW
ncbi:hypothetical protein REPUB_Repub11eG0066100 [Reevesia pubescens]